MRDIYTEEELEILAKHLEFDSLIRFKGFLANYNDLEEIEDIFDNPDKYEPTFIAEIKKIKENLILNYDLSGQSIKDKALTVIAITKELNKNYILKKFEGKIDEEIAEKLVEYGYTHGSCNSLVYTLNSLFGCQIKLFKVDKYGHQCVKVDDKYYDICGETTEEEMKSFVAREGKANSSVCAIEDLEPQEWKHKALDWMLVRLIDKVFYLTDENVSSND